MATSELDGISPNTKVLPDTSSDRAVHDLFVKDGLYYHENAEIGDLAAALGSKAPNDGLSRLLAIVSRDPVWMNTQPRLA